MSNCNDCQFFAEVADQPLGKGEGICRRFPPQAITIGDTGWATVYVPVKRDGWCGEWKWEKQVINVRNPLGDEIQ